ncbi:hypothetical protein MAFF212519_15170 [Clavibacter michiganensis]
MASYRLEHRLVLAAPNVSLDAFNGTPLLRQAQQKPHALAEIAERHIVGADRDLRVQCNGSLPE